MDLVYFLFLLSALANPVHPAALAPRSTDNGAGLTAAVASDVGVCSDVGISIVKAGGNAADAVCGNHWGFISAIFSSAHV